MPQCQVFFLDCMGYYDMVSQLISLSLLLIVLTKTLINIYNLFILIKSPQKDIQLTKSHKRKLIINSLSLIYQLSLFATVLFSLLLFLIYNDNILKAGENKINLWYKWSEIIFINLLNCLILTVGFLYWKAVRLYFKLTEQSAPLIYNTWAKFIFGFFYFTNFAIIALSLVLLLTTDETHYEHYEIKVINMINSIGVGCSTVVCLANRFLYQQKVLNNITMAKQALRKQRMYSIMIAFSGCCRLGCMVMNLMGVDYANELRTFNQNCLDSTPYHAILMLSITFLINIVPPVIFSFMFSPIIQTQRSYHQINHFLCKNDESVMYV